MLWLTAGIVATAIMGVVSIVDSHLISRRMPRLRSFVLPLGLLHLGFSLVTLGLNPLPEEIGATHLLAAFTSGTVRSAAGQYQPKVPSRLDLATPHCNIL